MVTQLAALENQGYHFRLHGDRLMVRRQGGSVDRAMLAGIDKALVINALRDRAAGFTPVEPQVIVSAYGHIDSLVERIKKALDDGTLWDARAHCHRKSGRIEFYLTPPGVIEEGGCDAGV